MRLERSIHEVLQILSISLTDMSPLKELYEKTKFNDVKKQFGLLIPGLFDLYLTCPNYYGTLMIVFSNIIEIDNVSQSVIISLGVVVELM